MKIRYAIAADIPAIQKLSYQHSKMLSRMYRDSLARSIDKGCLFVADSGERIVGFTHWNNPTRGANKGWNVIYNMAVSKAHQGQGIGRMLLYSVPCPIRLKCTQDNPANQFYVNAGMSLTGTERGKKRALNVYEMRVLAVIVRGGNSDVPGIAQKSGSAYGVHHLDTVYAWPYMVDSDPERCDWSEMMAVVNRWHPVQALTMDYFSGQRDLMLAQVADLKAAGVLRIAICPKFDGAVADIPQDCIVAVSLRTKGKLTKGANKYAGFMPRFEELKGRRVHLLGGSPKLQKDTIIKIHAVGARVLSVDGNAQFGSAALGSAWIDGRWRRKIGERANVAQTATLSSRNIQQELNAAAAWSQPPLFRGES